MRKDNRRTDQLRKVQITPHILNHPEGSAEIIMGNTRIICSASLDLSVPKWIQTPETGWVTAEYGMLPRSTHTRMRRDKTSTSGRSQEISRLIGRSLRSSVNLKGLGERQIHIDCDVIQADGGTRTAAITGGFVALALALESLKKEVMIKHIPLNYYVAATSVGIVNKELLLDLCYKEDQKAKTDMNVVFSSTGQLIEIQGTAEEDTFSRKQLNQMLDMAWSACQTLFKEQEKIIGPILPLSLPT
ncbi:MAG: ribonuclease PH [Bdellovibrionales bacterium]|nr:ribonuclease PH [Bdellovibrionales bacterium]